MAIFPLPLIQEEQMSSENIRLMLVSVHLANKFNCRKRNTCKFCLIDTLGLYLGEESRKNSSNLVP